MKRDQWLQIATTRLELAGISTPRLDATVMIEYALDQDRSVILAHAEVELSPAEQEQLNSLLDQRVQRQPLAYLLGHKEFFGLNFKVGPEVLVPRPETEALVEYTIKHAPQKATCLEIGTGSGCISVALAVKRPDLTITASDISVEALATAERNAVSHKAPVKFVESDMFSNLVGGYDVILANLPYVPIEARRQPEITHEPDISLYGGSDGLDHYRTFFAQVRNFTKPECLIVVEFSPTQYAAARNEFADFDIEPITEYIYLCRL